MLKVEDKLKAVIPYAAKRELKIIRKKLRSATKGRGLIRNDE